MLFYFNNECDSIFSIMLELKKSVLNIFKSVCKKSFGSLKNNCLCVESK